MTVVSSREFITNQKRYFDMAVNENIFIKRGKNRFGLVHTNTDNTNIPEQPVLEPDEDFYRAVSMDEFKKWVREDIHQIYNVKK